MMDNDTVDLREVAGGIRRGLDWVVGSLVAGLLVAVAVIRFLPSEYEGTATVLVRGSDSGPSALAQLGGLTDMLPIAGLGGLGGSSLSTEVEILTSRAVVGEVVDSLGLQARIRTPEGLGLTDAFSAYRFEPDLVEGSYEFERDGAAYRVSGPGAAARATPGEPLPVGGMTVVLSGSAPERFKLQVLDREDAIDAALRELEVEEVTNDVAELVFRESDPVRAAAVPNLLVEKYLNRRRTVDRGVNQHRYEFLLAHTDTLSRQLRTAEEALRIHQESTGVLDPELSGRTGVERAMVIQSELESLEVESRALETVLAQQGAPGAASARQLAAYPTFLRNPAVNSVLDRLLELDTERLELLQRRTERDPEVVALTESVEHLEGQLTVLSSDYLSGLHRQRAELEQELSRYRGELSLLPGHAEESLRLQREVRRLSETLVLLQSQLVQARLGAIAEGGEVRQIDGAVPPKRPAFPSAPVFLVVGLIGGLLTGIIGALGREYLGSKVLTPQHAALAAGAPALRLNPNEPLLLGGGGAWKSVLLVPVGAGAEPGTVGKRMANSAALRGVRVAMLDLESASLPARVMRPAPAVPVAALPGGREVGGLRPLEQSETGPFPLVWSSTDELDVEDVRQLLEDLESRLSLVIVSAGPLGKGLTTAVLDEGRAVVLVAREGLAARSELRDAAQALRRAGMHVAGIVLHNGTGRGDPDA